VRDIIQNGKKENATYLFLLMAFDLLC